jgi:hypothetical protein
MNGDQHEMSVGVSGGAIEAIQRAGPIQRIGGQYATAIAVQIPRSIRDVQRNLEIEAKLAGSSFYYGWAVKNKDTGKSDIIEGPSVNLAQAAARCWGNCAVETLPVQQMGTSWIFTAAFVDLETGFTLSRQFRQDMSKVIYGRMDDERKMDIRFQIGQSKATRNVLLNALPSWLIDGAMAVAKEGAKQKIEQYIAANGIAEVRKRLLAEFAKVGVKAAAVLRKADVAAVDGLQVDDLVRLTSDLHAIQNGQESVEALFPQEAERKSPAEDFNARVAANTRSREAAVDPPHDDAPIQEEPSEREYVHPAAAAEEANQRGAVMDRLRKAYSTLLAAPLGVARVASILGCKKTEVNGRLTKESLQSLSGDELERLTADFEAPIGAEVAV